MPWTDKHVTWLTRAKDLKSKDGDVVEVWNFEPKSDHAILAAWAKHFRNHYCLDTEIEALRKGTGLTKAEYLRKIRFPDSAAAPGPSIRSGDFAEILVADYVQFVLKYWVPRTRYAAKTVRNESTKGCDILGFRILNKSKDSKNDVLALFEAKAQLTGEESKPRLQDAIDDSAKDELRKAESLNAIKQRLLDSGSLEGTEVIERFQNLADRPYTQKNGAVAVFSNSAYCEKTISATSGKNHPNPRNLSLMVIRGDRLMELVHQLYDKAANEA